MRWIESVSQDVRHALRAIVRAPLLSTVVIVSLAAGIGVNTVVFAWIQHRLLQPLPGVHRSADLHLVEARTDAGMYAGVSWLEYEDLRERLAPFPDLFAFRIAPFYVGEPGRVERVYGMLVSGNYFRALGIRPVLGRFIEPAEVTRSRGEPVAVISHGLWQSRYGGAPDALGRTLRVNGRDLIIVGVTPRAFQGTVLGLYFDVWIPATLAPQVIAGTRELEARGFRTYLAMGRLGPDATRQHAQAALDAAMTDLARAYPETNATMRGEVLRFWQFPRGPQRMMTFALAILQGIMLLLLLAVCGNTATLSLARASARHREIGVRLALGARPGRIAALLMTENVVLALFGALLAVPVAIWGTQAFRTLPLSGLPIRFQTSVDIVGLLFAMALGVVCGLLVGAPPAMQLARLDPQLALRSGARTAHRSRLRNALMGTQVGLALVVLLVAGLFFRSFMETRDTDPGFRRAGVMLGAYDLAGSDSALDARQFPTRLLDGLRNVPAVEHAAVSAAVPLDIHGLPSRVFTVDGWTRTDPGFDQALTNTVTPGYFALLDIPLLAGTDFAPLTDSAAPPQAIVNEAFVRRYLPELEPLGRRLQARGRAYVIVGVVRNSLSNAFGEPPTPVIYLSYRDNPVSSGQIHVRTRPGAEGAIVPAMRQALGEINPELPLFNVRTLTEHIEANLIFRRVPARLFAVLGPMLLVLAAIGIYAVVAYTVSLRTTELGVRLAVGATPRRLIRECIADSFGVILTGAVIGWVLAFAVAIVMSREGALDLAVFAGVPLVLLAVAAVACWLPARRAGRVEPVAALRCE